MGPGVASPLSLLHGTQRPENHGSLIEGSAFSLFPTLWTFNDSCGKECLCPA